MKKIFKIIFILIISITIFYNMDIEIFAGTNYKNTIKFNFENKYYSNGNNKTIAKANNVIEAMVLDSKGNVSDIYVNIYTDTKEINTVIENNGYIASTQIRVEIISNYTVFDKTVKDGYGNVIYSLSSNDNAFIIEDLIDDTYYVTVIGRGYNSFNTSFNNTYLTEINFSFNVDTTKPTIDGASTSMDGLYEKNSIELKGIDNGSGIDSIYVQEPNSVNFIKMSNSLIKKPQNGLYIFYSKDNVGNTSNYYYVYFDNINPTGVFKDINGNIINIMDKEYINTSFYFEGEDSSGKISHILYKSPNSKSWARYVEKTVLTDEGLYQFVSVDKANNQSNIYKIYLDKEVPSGYIINDEDQVINDTSSTSQYIKFISNNDASGIKEIYMKHNDSDYELYNENMKLYESGIYSFYLIDNALNQSEVYTIILDNLPPEISIINAEAYTQTNNSFTINISDDNDTKLYYKYPDSINYIETSDKTITINDTSIFGKYYFYAIDKYSNMSKVIWITLGSNNPVINIVSIKDSNKVYLTWNGKYTVLVNSKEYSKNEIISKEGNYIVEATDENGNTTVTNFTIKCYHELYDVVEATCEHDGYTLLKCISCNNIIKTNYVEGGTHKYDSIYKEPTCEDMGGIYYYCIYCNSSYITNTVPPIGHIYEYETYSPTCIDEGYMLQTCINCNSYIYEVLEKVDHEYIILDITETIEYYECIYCGEIIEKDIESKYQTIVNFSKNLFKKYQPYMIVILISSVSIFSLLMGVKMIIAKKNEEKEKVYQMLRNYIIGICIIFVLLVAIPYLIKGISIILI